MVNLEKSVAYLLVPFEPDLGFDQWQKIQIALTDRGFSPGPVDGISGPHTRNAIRQFQLKSGADATGHLTRPQVADLWGLQSPQARSR
jgi:peptidoglycan hydrolase-like protein with peptidoglycan-binding domain